MVTSNSGEGRSKNTNSNNYRSGERKDGRPYRKEAGDNTGERGQRRERKTGYQQGGNRDNTGNGGNGGSSFNRGNGGNVGGENGRGGYGQRRDSYKSSDNSGTNRPFKKKYGERNYGNPYDKDEEDTAVKTQKRQSASRDGKAKEPQPDKFEIKNRIEKEKKAMQKKQSDRKNAKPSRMQNRPKRTNNIDWTREYENGSYDDDELDMYL